MIYLGLKQVKSNPIEWSSSSKTEEIAWLAQCKHCLRRVWFRKADLYQARDNTIAVRCPKCGVGKSRHGDWQRLNIEPYKTFSPKNLGWCPILKDSL